MLTQGRLGRGVRGRVVRALDAAATPHGFDRYAELVLPTWSSTEVRGRIVEVRRQTAQTVTLTVEANRNWREFEAGQYTQLTVEVDGVRHTRCYSMASSATPGGRRFELTVKAHPGGLVSNFLVGRAAPGMVVGLTSAAGSFVLPATRPDRVLLVSGGSGITPVMSMLRTLCDEGFAGPVTFAHYCLTAADMTYASELEALAGAYPNVAVVRVFTDEPGAGDLDGFVSVGQLDSIDREWRSAETYLCGPAPLMSAMEAIYSGEGISARLHTEAFTLTQFVAEAGEVGGEICFAGSAGGGATVTSDGRSVLAQAEAAGLKPASGCRMGICRTCTCPLLKGTVRDVTTGDLTTGRTDGPPEVIRICVSTAVGDIEIDL